MKFDLKIGHRMYTITEKDRVMFNGACYLLITQTVFLNWHSYNPTLAQAKCKKWIKDGVLQKTYQKNLSGIDVTYYKFIKEV